MKGIANHPACFCNTPVDWRFGLPKNDSSDFELELPPLWLNVPAYGECWMPVSEVAERKERYQIRAELPGVKLEDIEISVYNCFLTIKGERKPENNVIQDDYHLKEQCCGSFCRVIELLPDIDGDKISATYEDGILEISIPRLVKSGPRRVPISKPRKKS